MITFSIIIFSIGVEALRVNELPIRECRESKAQGLGLCLSIDYVWEAVANNKTHERNGNEVFRKEGWKT